MHPRFARRVRARWLWLFAMALAGCASTPPSRTETAAIRQIREEYLRVYPEGRYNAEINRGEIVRGMSLYEVLASWGIPDARSASPERNRERWVYVLLDDNAADWVRYEFLFTGNELVEWEQSRNIASGEALDLLDSPKPAPLPSWAQGGSPSSRSIR